MARSKPTRSVTPQRPRLDVTEYLGQWIALHPETYEVLGHGSSPEDATQAVPPGKTEQPLLYFVSESNKLAVKLIPSFELSDAEKQRILDEGWAVVEKARARNKDVPASVIQKEVDRAVREVRARHSKRRR